MASKVLDTRTGDVGMEDTPQRIPVRIRIPLLAAATAFLVHLVCNPHYGFHGVELYFIICGRHPQWNYVDQPPIAPLLAAASQMFGPSLVLLRAVPALFAGAGIYATADHDRNIVLSGIHPGSLQRCFQ